MNKPIYRPSQVLRKIKSNEIADPQPRGEGRIFCEAHRHPIAGDTESPSYWENGMYVHCEVCGERMLARVEFKGFVIDLTGERKKYPMKWTDAAR